MAPKKKKKEKAEAKAKVEAEAKGKGKPKDKDKDKAKAEAKGKGKAKGKEKKKAKDKGKPEAKDKGKGKDKKKAKAEAEAKGKPKGKDKGKGKGKGKAKAEAQAQRVKPDQIAMQIVTPEDLDPPDATAEEPAEAPADANTAHTERAPPVRARPAQRRWERVAARLGLEQHARAIAGWDGQGDPPPLSGFSFVRHVESDARDLRCAGTARTLTQGVIIQREDDKLFLVGRGVAQTYLGLAVPRKDRANAGQRFLTPLEREALGQPPG
jgi:hypothetical protein